jgi:hypothetical protein
MPRKAKITEEQKKEYEKWRKINAENIASLTGAAKEKFEELERITSAPDFDEDAFERENFLPYEESVEKGMVFWDYTDENGVRRSEQIMPDPKKLKRKARRAEKRGFLYAIKSALLS